MSKRVIFHIDVNSAFLSWEAVYRMQVLGDTVDLRDIPSAIGGDIEKRKGVILAKSIPAKKYQIQTGEPVVAALRKCPQLVLAKPNHRLYEAYSRSFIKVLREYSPIVEQCSIDEAYMDMTGTEKLYGSPIDIAHTIKDRIYKELGFTVNIGISHNKLLAKMASDFQKPNLVHTLFQEEIETKMWPLEIRELFSVGKASEEKLKKLGIHTIGQLAHTDISLLRSHLNKQGEVIFHYANGRDLSEVIAKKVPNKSYGNSTTIPYDVSSVQEAKKVILSLCETVGARLRADGAQTSCVSVSIVDIYFEHISHQKTLHSATNTTHEIYEYAQQVFDELWNHKTPIRQIGVHTSKIEYGESYQYNLFDMNKNEKYAKLDQAIDKIRNKYGESSVMRTTFVGDPLSHMVGGIRKERL